MYWSNVSNQRVRSKILEFLNSEEQPPPFSNVMVEGNLARGRMMKYAISGPHEQCDFNLDGCEKRATWIVPSVTDGKVDRELGTNSIIVRMACRMCAKHHSCVGHGLPYIHGMCEMCKEAKERQRILSPRTNQVTQRKTAKKKKCGWCSEYGHNIRTCPRYKARKLVPLDYPK